MARAFDPAKCGTARGRDQHRHRGEAPCEPCRAAWNEGYNIAISPAARLAIYERDGWTCQVCLEPVDPAAPRNSTWDATLDHVVPRSRGGSDALENLRLAHRWCNSVRNDLSCYSDDDLRVGEVA